MQNTPWRHVMAVSVMVIVLVAVMLYCITPDALDASVSVARYRARQFIESVSASRIAATVSGRVSAVLRETPATPPSAISPIRSRVRIRRLELVELRTGPDPFRPYTWRASASGMPLDGLREYAPETLGGLAFGVFLMWARRRGRRLSRMIFVKEEKMAACLARAVRQMESY